LGHKGDWTIKNRADPISDPGQLHVSLKTFADVHILNMSNTADEWQTCINTVAGNVQWTGCQYR